MKTFCLKNETLTFWKGWYLVLSTDCIFNNCGKWIKRTIKLLTYVESSSNLTLFIYLTFSFLKTWSIKEAWQVVSTFIDITCPTNSQSTSLVRQSSFLFLKIYFSVFSKHGFQSTCCSFHEICRFHNCHFSSNFCGKTIFRDYFIGTSNYGNIICFLINILKFNGQLFGVPCLEFIDILLFSPSFVGC